MACKFDGASANRLQSGSNFAILDPITCAAWIKLDSTAALVRAIVGGHDWNNFNHHFAAYAAYLRFSFYNSGLRRYQSDNAILSADTWHHVAVTHVAYGEPQFYVDGSPVDGSWTHTTGTNTLASGARPLCIGGAPRDAYYFYGTITEVAEWNKALTAAQIERLYADGMIMTKRPLMVQYADLECYYPLNDHKDGEQVTDAKDASGNGVDLTAQDTGIDGEAIPVASFGVAPLVITEAAGNAMPMAMNYYRRRRVG